LTSFGAGLEYDDFVIHGLLATYLGKACFTAQDAVAAMLEVFGVFAVGYLVRPLGGLLFGHLGDRYGRKPIFLMSLFLMASATFAIGILPTYQQIGLTATLLLLLLRILQGIAFGAEIPGTVTYLAEHAQQTARGFHCGLALSGVSLGAFSGAAFIFALEKILTQQQLLQFGWRIPLACGGLLAIVSYFLRRRLPETPAFILQKSDYANLNQPVLYLFKHYSGRIALGISISLFSACFIVFGVGLPAYLHQFYGYPVTQVYLVTALGYLWSALLLPIFGRMSDKIGRAQQLICTALLAMFINVALFPLLHWHTLLALLIFIFLYQTLVASLANCYLPLLTELFPTSVRLSGVAFCYNLVYCVAGFTPLLLSKFAEYSDGRRYTLLFFTLLAGLTVIGALLAARKINQEFISEKKLIW